MKGVAFLNLLTSLREVRGEAMTARALALSPPNVRAAIEARELLAGGWYAGDDYRALLRAVLRASEEPPAFLRELGLRSTLRDFRGIYRLLCFVVAPESLLKRAAGIYDRYRRGGRLVVTQAREGHAEGLFENCRDFDQACWQDVLGGAEGVLTACGAQKLRMTILDGGNDGDTWMRFEGRWAT